MDQITHAALGMFVAGALYHKRSEFVSLPRKQLYSIAAIAAIFPDIDYLLFWLNPLDFLAYWHRSYTHSLLLVPLWAALLSGFCWLLGVRTIRWRALLLLCALCLLSHIAIDLLTIFGTRLLQPFGERQFSLGTSFVVDPILSLIILISLALSILRDSALPARLGIGLLFFYLTLQYVASHQAKQLALKKSQQLGLSSSKAMVLPQPLSPSHWLLLVESQNKYHLARVDILADDKPSRSKDASLLENLYRSYQPVNKANWQSLSIYGEDRQSKELAMQVWSHPQFKAFTDFASLPLLHRIDRSPDETCVWFTDLRYLWPEITPPFRYGMCRQNEAGWKLYRLQRFSEQKQRL